MIKFPFCRIRFLFVKFMRENLKLRCVFEEAIYIYIFNTTTPANPLDELSTKKKNWLIKITQSKLVITQNTHYTKRKKDKAVTVFVLVTDFCIIFYNFHTNRYRSIDRAPLST